MKAEILLSFDSPSTSLMDWSRIVGIDRLVLVDHLNSKHALPFTSSAIHTYYSAATLNNGSIRHNCNMQHQDYRNPELMQAGMESK